MVQITKLHFKNFTIVNRSGVVAHYGNQYFNLPKLSSETVSFLMSKGLSNFDVDTRLLRSYPKFGPRKEHEIKQIQNMGEW